MVAIVLGCIIVNQPMESVMSHPNPIEYRITIQCGDGSFLWLRDPGFNDPGAESWTDQRHDAFATIDKAHAHATAAFIRTRLDRQCPYGEAAPWIDVVEYTM
jgi:hypothetical protein